MQAVLKGIEGTLNQQESRYGGDAAGQRNQGVGDEHGLIHRDRRQQRTNDRFRVDHQRCGKEQHQQPHVAQRVAQLLTCRMEVLRCYRPRDEGEYGGGDGYRNQRIRQDVQGEGVLVGSIAGNVVQTDSGELMRTLRGQRGDSGQHDIRNLSNRHHTQRSQRHRSHRLETKAGQAKAGTVFEAQANQRHEQDQCLKSHAERPCTCGKRHFARGPEIKRLFVGLAEQHDECGESGAADDVGSGGTPRIGGKMIFGGQNLTKHRV